MIIILKYLICFKYFKIFKNMSESLDYANLNPNIKYEYIRYLFKFYPKLWSRMIEYDYISLDVSLSMAKQFGYENMITDIGNLNEIFTFLGAHFFHKYMDGELFKTQQLELYNSTPDDRIKLLKLSIKLKQYYLINTLIKRLGRRFYFQCLKICLENIKDKQILYETIDWMLLTGKITLQGNDSLLNKHPVWAHIDYIPLVRELIDSNSPNVSYIPLLNYVTNEDIFVMLYNWLYDNIDIKTTIIRTNTLIVSVSKHKFSEQLLLYMLTEHKYNETLVTELILSFTPGQYSDKVFEVLVKYMKTLDNYSNNSFVNKALALRNRVLLDKIVELGVRFSVNKLIDTMSTGSIGLVYFIADNLEYTTHVDMRKLLAKIVNKGYLQLFSRVVDKHNVSDILNIDFISQLFKDSYMNNHPRMSALVDKLAKKYNIIIDYHQTLLMLVETNNIIGVDHILSLGADPNRDDAIVLYIAKTNNFTDIVNTLFKHGANSLLASKHGPTKNYRGDQLGSRGLPTNIVSVPNLPSIPVRGPPTRTSGRVRPTQQPQQSAPQPSVVPSQPSVVPQPTQPRPTITIRPMPKINVRITPSNNNNQ